MKIAVDAMGGDNAPASNVLGAIAAARIMEELEIVLVGRETSIAAFGPLPRNVRVAAAPEVIENDEKPLLAIR